MKVLWITNFLFPPIANKIGISSIVKEGWTYSSAKSLLEVNHNIELAVASVYAGKEFLEYKIDDILYYLLPSKPTSIKYYPELEVFWKKVYSQFNPDIVHIHGTEFTHGLSFLKACPHANTVISIQGMVSVIARYYLSNISLKNIYTNLTFHDVIKTTIVKDQKIFFKRGENEKEMIRRVGHIIGRTSWDKAHVWAINPRAKYHFCNETLRSEFYKHVWTYENCEPHSIFMSQSGYPIKGLHQVLKALPLVLRKFPDTKIYVAGANIIDDSTFNKKIRMLGYAKYIKYLINKLKLQDNVFFTGTLNENQMCNRFLHSNLYLSASSIENSPNSLGEAQLLGMPCIASYVGGTPDMMVGNEHWMYRFDEIEMLAQLIIEIFELQGSRSFSYPEAHIRHDKNINSQKLSQIYTDMIKNVCEK